MRSDHVVRHGDLVIALRPNLAIRERPNGDRTLLYLSLFDDEIEDRCTAFLAAGCSGTALELTDTAILFERERSVVLRGSASTIPLFSRRDGACAHLTTQLPLASEPVFSRHGLAAQIAAVCLNGCYEPNAWVETPLAGWQRVRRGFATMFAGGVAEEEYAVQDRVETGTPTEDAVVQRIANAFEAYRHSQRQVTASLLELSGGYDSTLAAAAALSQSHRMHGASVAFPYYEFRFEADVQRATAKALGVPREEIDGETVFPYAPTKRPARFDEPTVYVTGLRHAERMGECAISAGAKRLYVGHGGDQLFATDLEALDPIAGMPSRAPFTKIAWDAIARAAATMTAPNWRQRSAGFFVYDAREDMWLKDTFDVTLRTPFTDLAVFRAARAWSRCSQARRVPPDKSILAKALAPLLPDAVRNRKGKVAYDGVWMRAHARQASHIAGVFERAAPMLEQIGISPSWLQRRVAALAAWQDVSSREVLGAYAIATWLIAWDLLRPEDIAWD